MKKDDKPIFQAFVACRKNEQQLKYSGKSESGDNVSRYYSLTMEKDILYRTLESIGYTRRQAQVYIAALECGTAPASVIAKESDINRVTAYNTLEELVHQGLFSTADMPGGRQYTPVAPETLLRDTKKRLADLTDILPLMQALQAGQDVKPLVRVYENLAGVKHAYEETLDAKTQMFNYANSHNIRLHWPEYDSQYVLRRAQQKIFLKGLAPDDEYGRQVQEQDAKYFRETRLKPRQHFLLENEINIFDDKVMIASFDPRPFAIVIQSHAVADSQRAIFSLAWGE